MTPERDHPPETERRPQAGIIRRDFFAGVGTAVAAAALIGPSAAGGELLAQLAPAPSPDNGAVADRKPIRLERLGNGILLIGIDRPDAQNRLDVPTFGALGQDYYEFEHDDNLRVAVLHGLGADFSQLGQQF